MLRGVVGVASEIGVGDGVGVASEIGDGVGVGVVSVGNSWTDNVNDVRACIRTSTAFCTKVNAKPIDGDGCCTNSCC